MQKNKFKLSHGANELFNKTVAAIREGIATVSEMRERENKLHSLSKVDFEKAYINKALGAVISTVAADIRGMTDILSKQAEKEAQGLADKLGYTVGDSDKIVGISKDKVIPITKKDDKNKEDKL